MSTNAFTQQLQTLRDSEVDQLGEERSALFRSSIDDLSRSGIVERSLKTGDKAPQFDLLNQSGESVSSRACLQTGPLVVTFYRGGWCPYCNVEMQALQSALSQIKDHGARILAISPERPEHAAEMAQKHGLEFDLLSDPNNSVAQQFGTCRTRFRTSTATWGWICPAGTTTTHTTYLYQRPT